MNPMTRRQFLATTALIPVAACVQSGAVSPPVVTVNLPSWASAIQAIGAYFTQNVLPTIQNAGASIPTDTVSTIEGIISGLSSATTAIGAASTETQGTSVLQTVEGYVNELAPVVAPFLGLVPGIGPVLTIAVAALPAIEGLVNLGSSLLTPLAQSLAAPSAPNAARLSSTQALAIVRQATGR